MEPNKKNQDNLQPPSGRHENPLPQEISDEQKVLNQSALNEAEKDISNDPDLSIHSPNDDLDEGETSRLGENVPV